MDEYYMVSESLFFFLKKAGIRAGGKWWKNKFKSLWKLLENVD